MADLKDLSTVELLERAKETINLCRLRSYDAELLIPELTRRLEAAELDINYWREVHYSLVPNHLQKMIETHRRRT